MSPSAADAPENETEGLSLTRRHRGEKRTRRHVAKLIGMKTVQPRAIAYVACQVSHLFGVEIDYDADRLTSS